MKMPLLRHNAFVYAALIAIWLAAYKSADIFGFFKTYSSLWFLPAGVTLSMALVLPKRFLPAPLIANLLLAIPAVCSALNIEFTNYHDPVMHAFRLFAIYAGLGLFLRHIIKVELPIGKLRDSNWLLGLSLLSAMLAALTGVSLHVIAGNMSWATAWNIILPWGVGDAIGAVIVPPLVCPLLFLLLGKKPSSDWRRSRSVNLLLQILTILIAMYIGFSVPVTNPDMGNLWYIILLPPVFFALQGGMSRAASGVFLTAMLSPPAAHYFGLEGERESLQLLILISSAVSLTIGAAITDRKRAFAELKENEQNLERQVANRTKELEDAYQFQKHLIRSLGHDLRQPVQSLNMMMDGLAIELKETSASKVILQARSIGKTASGFIAKVLDFAKRDAGDIQVQIADVPLQNIFNILSATFAPVALERGVELDIELSDLKMKTDELLLTEALFNLVDNSVRLSLNDQAVTIRAIQSQDNIHIEIVDQINTHNPSGQTQTGFGLEIVKQICGLIQADFCQFPNKAVIVIPDQGVSKT